MAPRKMSLERPHGPTSRWPWGLLPTFHRDPLTLLERVGRRYPSMAALPFGPWTLYLATGDKAVADVLRTHKDHFRKGPGMEAKNPLIGQGMLLSEGDLWREQRRAIMPVFSHNAIKAYHAAIAHEVNVGAQKFFSAANVDAGVFGRYLALAVTLSTLFGLSPKDELISRLGESTSQVMEHFHHRARSLYRPPYAWPKAFNGAFHQSSDVLRAFVEPLLDRPNTPLLEILAQSPPDRRAQEALTFLIAGHETTGNALAWTLRLLADHPEVVERVSQEAEGGLVYSEAVVLESLRLFPPVWLLSRTAIQNVEVDHYHLAAGSQFLVSPWVTHRLESYYPEAESFLPERWLDGGEIKRTRTDYRFLAFGGGPRRCPGEEFALAELSLAVANICRRWRLRSREPFPSPTPGMTLSPRGGLEILACPR